MKITKEMIFEQFKDVTKKDQSKKKETYTNRIEFLKTLKDDIKNNPKNFDISPTQQQLQNLIDDWSSPNPRDAFYMEQMVDWLQSGKQLPTSEESILKALGL